MEDHDAVHYSSQIPGGSVTALGALSIFVPGARRADHLTVAWARRAWSHAPMIAALAALLCCQLAGEIAARTSGIPVPGPVIGMLILWGLLLVRGAIRRSLPAVPEEGTLERTAQGLLAHLSLLFVPAGVGVIQRLDVIGAHAGAIAVALVGSVVIGLFAAVWTFRVLSAWGRGKP